MDTQSGGRDEPAVKACLRDNSFAIKYPDVPWDISFSRANCRHFPSLSLSFTFCAQPSSKMRPAGSFLWQALPFDFLNVKRKMAGDTAAADSLQGLEGQGT
jgi:hypothetical protein